jgi:hypothetical protein
MTVSNTFNVRIVSSDAPAWFNEANLPLMTWVPVAAGALRTDLAPWQRGFMLSDVVSPGPYQGAQSQDDIIEAGNGVAINQTDRELYYVCNGGHSGRQENDSFRTVFNADTPYNQRITNSTPYEDLDWHFDSSINGGLPSAGAWRDLWQPSTAYVATDKISYDAAGVIKCYVCTAPHTSSAAFATDSANWLLVVEDGVPYQYWSRIQVLRPATGVAASGTRNWISPTGATVDIRDYPACAGDGAISDPASNKSRQAWTPWNISSLNDINDRPRTMHTAFTPWYANGKVWFPIQNSVDVGTGFALNVILSFNVAQVLSGTLPRTFSPGRDVWDYYETVTEMGVTGNLFGATCLDSYTNKVWYHPGNEQRFYSVRTDAAAGQRRTVYSDYISPNGDFLLAASAICPVPGRRLWVVLTTGVGSAGYFRIYDLDMIEQGQVNATSCEEIYIPAAAAVSWNFNHTSSSDFAKGWGMVWYEKDRSFLLYSCDDMNRGGARSGYLRRLRPPLLNDAYNRGQPWLFDEVAVTGLPDQVTGPGTASVSGCSFTRFNIFNDMGNGESMLVSQGSYNTPCYVCRLSDTLIGV